MVERGREGGLERRCRECRKCEFVHVCMAFSLSVCVHALLIVCVFIYEGYNILVFVHVSVYWDLCIFVCVYFRV